MIRCRTFILTLLIALIPLTGSSAQENGRAVDAGGFSLGMINPIGEATESRSISRTALRRIAEIQGIPHTFIDNPGELEGYRAAVMAEAPSNAVLTPAWTEALYSFVEDGGVLLVPGLPGSDLFTLLGIGGVNSNHTRTRIEFSGRDPILAYIDHPKERSISLGNGEKHVYDEVIWSHGAQAGGMTELLARFDDGSAALTRNYYGRGIVYFLGVGFSETVLLPQTGGDFEAQRKFVNSVEPSADTIMLLVKALYEEYVPRAVYLSPVPDARPTALIMTHDVDAQTSFIDSLEFAGLAEEFGTRATFFVNTKYFENWQDIAYYSVPENLEAVRELHRRGHEIASHTVAHSLDLKSAPVGSSEERYATYRPERRITIHGESRVSKELLERDIPGSKVESFRAGYLAFPPELIEVLEESGYLYDSSFSANDVLTTFPYFAFRERRPGSGESSVIEIPLTLDDAVGFLTEDTVDRAIRIWKEIIRAHADNETITVLLNHPSDTRTKSYKLDAQRGAMEYARSLDSWMGTLGDFGDFWRARHGVRIRGVAEAGGRWTVRLDQKRNRIHPWIGIVLPSGPDAGMVEVLDSEGKSIPFTARLAGGKTFIALEP
jgi:peptidoglycan/xylan/chitin deacetylase (PgdA/CDA1 family)